MRSHRPRAIRSGCRTRSSIYQGRVALSPGIEEQYKSLTRDYDTAQKFYNDLLARRASRKWQTDMERRQQGEQMRLLNPAGLPDTPSFPNRLLFAGGGLGGGLCIGLGLGAVAGVARQIDPHRAGCAGGAGIADAGLRAVDWRRMPQTQNVTAIATSGSKAASRREERNGRGLRSPMYKEFFGLRANPFNVNPDPRYLVSDAAYGGGAGLPDLWHPEPQGLCAADGRSRHGQDHADQQIAGVAAAATGGHRVHLQFADERHRSFSIT